MRDTTTWVRRTGREGESSYVRIVDNLVHLGVGILAHRSEDKLSSSLVVRFGGRHDYSLGKVTDADGVEE